MQQLRAGKGQLSVVFVTGGVLAAIFVGAALVLLTQPQTGHSQAKPPAATAPGSTLEQRVTQRKAEKPITLDARDQQRVASMCTNAQAKLRTLKQKTTSAVDTRTGIYKSIDGKLWIAVGKLKLADKDTFELEKQRAALAADVAAYEAMAKEYQLVLDDAALVNCKADPAGFKSLLETARDYRKALRSQIEITRNNVVNNVKPVLTNHATELKGKAGTN